MKLDPYTPGPTSLTPAVHIPGDPGRRLLALSAALAILPVLLFGMAACGGQSSLDGANDGGAPRSGNPFDVPSSRNDDAGSRAPADAGRDGSRDGGDGGDSDAPGSPGALISSAENLIDLFPLAEGAILVREHAVVVIDHEGTSLRTWASARAITSAAFDGTYLAIADTAMLTTLTPALSVVATVALTETCASSAIVDRARFVCGPGNDWDRVFYVYDLVQGRRLTSSSPYTYNGIPMRKIPGTNDFVTVTTSSSPSDYHLYRVNEDDAVVFVGESPYHGDFTVNATYAFVGVPATHLVTPTGLFLRIYGPGFTADAGRFGENQFIKDGVLGAFPATQWFAAMDQSAGQIMGLVGSNGSWPNGATSTYGLQRIDPATRTVLSSRPVTFPAHGVSLFKHDAHVERAWVALGRSADSWNRVPGFDLWLLDY